MKLINQRDHQSFDCLRIGDCLFNGNHFQTQAQCELSCVRRPAAMSDGGALLPTRQPICYTRIEFRVQGDCRSRPLLRNSRWQMQVSGQETPVTPDAGAAAPFFVFDAKLNKCRAQHLHECVWNGNRFETLDHCLWNCIPRSFDCPYCDAHRYRKWQSVCNHSKQSRHLYECFVQARSFNWTALHEEVLRLEQLFGNTGLTIVLARSLLWLTALVAILPLRAHF